MGLLVCCFAAQPIAAAPIIYAIHFWRSGPPMLPPWVETMPTSGTFTYDPDVPQFTDFHILWAGMDLDFTAVANAPTVDPADPVCSDPGPRSTFAMLSGACSSNGVWWGGSNQRFFMADISDNFPWIEVNFSTGERPGGMGTWTISEVPEPASLLLVLLGLTGLLATRRLRAA